MSVSSSSLELGQLLDQGLDGLIHRQQRLEVEAVARADQGLHLLVGEVVVRLGRALGLDLDPRRRGSGASLRDPRGRPHGDRVVRQVVLRGPVGQVRHADEITEMAGRRRGAERVAVGPGPAGARVGAVRGEGQEPRVVGGRQLAHLLEGPVPEHVGQVVVVLVAVEHLGTRRRPGRAVGVFVDLVVEVLLQTGLCLCGGLQHPPEPAVVARGHRRLRRGPVVVVERLAHVRGHVAERVHPGGDRVRVVELVVAALAEDAARSAGPWGGGCCRCRRPRGGGRTGRWRGWHGPGSTGGTRRCPR